MRRFYLLLVALLATFAALRAEPTTPAAPPTLAAARELFTARRDAEAQSAFEQLLAANPANHEAIYHLGRLAKRRGEWKAVTDYYERCTQLAPTNALYWADLGEAYGKLAARAGIFQQLSLARKCRTALEKAVDLAPDDFEYRHGLIEFYEKAPALVGGGHDKALAQAAAIAQRDPFAGALLTGNLQAHAKNWPEAETAFCAAATLQPEATEPLACLGVVYAEQSRYADAFAQFDKLLARHPDDSAALFQLGRYAAISGQRLADGSATLRRYLAQPNRAVTLPPPQHAYYRLGQILARQGDPAAARTAFETALQLDPKFKDAAAELGKLPP